MHLRDPFAFQLYELEVCPHYASSQSITALAHLRAAVLYIVDISEQCGHTIQQQAALFNSIKPLFASKPLMIVLNKIDVTPLDTLSEEDRATLKDMSLEALKTTAAGQSCPLSLSLLPSRRRKSSFAVRIPPNSLRDDRPMNV